MIDVVPKSEGNKTIISWNVTRIANYEQDIQIIFAEPGEISNDKIKDWIRVKYLNPGAIIRT